MGNVVALFSAKQFDPELTHAMGEAFDGAWTLLEGKGPLPADEVRLELGRRIVELAQRGERDAEKLSAYAVAMMRLRSRVPATSSRE